MDFKTYVQNVVAAYVEKPNKKIIFIKHYNTLDISEEEVLASVKKLRMSFSFITNILCMICPKLMPPLCSG